MGNLTGQSLGRYHILEQLGEGGMATVYKACDTHLDRDVAVKIIRADIFGTTVLQRIHRRFEREAKALAKLSHPNIVSVIEYGEYNGSPFLVMEYVPAGTLKGKLGKPIDWQDAVRMLVPVARALAYSHHHGIIHRDVKPSNILITETGDLMLTDFGIAKVLDGDDGQTLTTGTGVGVGTPEYMAPEQGLGHEADVRADIYSLGIVLYELITGRKPYRADTPMAVIVKHINDPLPRPRQFVQDVPEVVEKVIFKALAKKPEDRYRNMDEFAKALDGLLDSAPMQEKTLARKKTSPATVKSTVQTANVAATHQRQLNSLKKGLLWIAGVSMLLFVGLGINLIGNGQRIYSLFSSLPTITATSSPVSTAISIVTPSMTFTSEPTSTPILTPTEEGGEIYLARLNPVNVKVGWSEFATGKYPFSEGPFLLGHTIQVNGVEYTYGLFAHAPSKLTYSLEKKYSSFFAYAFLDGYSTCKGAVRFIIVLDGKEVYRSPILRYQTPVKPIEVSIDVSGSDVLSLETDDLDDNYCDLTFWGDPYLLR